MRCLSLFFITQMFILRLDFLRVPALVHWTFITDFARLSSSIIFLQTGQSILYSYISVMIPRRGRLGSLAPRRDNHPCVATVATGSRAQSKYNQHISTVDRGVLRLPRPGIIHKLLFVPVESEIHKWYNRCTSILV